MSVFMIKIGHFYLSNTLQKSINQVLSFGIVLVKG